MSAAVAGNGVEEGQARSLDPCMSFSILSRGKYKKEPIWEQPGMRGEQSHLM